MTPLVSIAIRAFRRRWLAGAMASVLAQSYGNLELVIYDDAGDLADVAASFGDSRVRYERASQHFQASGRFRAAVDRCRGEFVGVLDDDDCYQPLFIERLLDALRADRGAGIAFCRTTIECDGRLSRPLDRRQAGRIDRAAHRMLSERWTVSPSHMLMRRAALDAAWRVLPMPDGVAPDLFVNVGVALAGWGHVLVDDYLVIYRWHDGQLSRRGLVATEGVVTTWQQMPFVDPELRALRDRLLARAHIVRGMERLCAGDRPGSLADFRAAAENSPHAWRRERLLLHAAARTGRCGGLVLKAWLAMSSRGRQRQQPPRVIGDDISQHVGSSFVAQIGA